MTEQNNREEGPIIRSFLDLDHYKLTMGQFAFRRYADIPVAYAFKNRTKSVKLAGIIDEKDLRRELDNIRTVRITEEETEYLRGLKNNGGRLFGEDYLNFLKNLQFPNYSLENENGEFALKFPGPWATAIYWETLALSVINELYNSALMKNMTPEEVRRVYETGRKRLDEKIALLEKNPDILFIEFGTRRRFSREWQEYIVKTLKDRIPKQIVGTSNVYLAMKNGLDPKGTMAHETFMIMSGITHKNDDEIRASHNKVLAEWWEDYGYDLSVALTDTYGSDFFFSDMTDEQARKWKGARQDSGDPHAFGRKEIKFYDNKGIDPKRKLFLPSDGLEIKSIVDIQNEFRGKILTAYGWGTSLTNDLRLKALSLVVKATESNGHGTVKLSDNPEKAIGKPEDILRFMKIFNYNPEAYARKECKY